MKTTILMVLAYILTSCASHTEAIQTPVKVENGPTKVCVNVCEFKGYYFVDLWPYLDGSFTCFCGTENDGRVYIDVFPKKR